MTDPRPTEHPELSATTEGTMLSLHVQPGATRPGIRGRHGDALRLRVTAPPTEGRANAEVIAWVATAFGLPRSSVHLVVGASNRRKRVLLTGVSVATAAAVIEELLGDQAPR